MRPSGLQSAAEYEQLIDFCPVVLFRQRPDFSFEYVSPKIDAWTGFSAEEWLRKPNLFKELIYEADLAALNAHLNACAGSDEVVSIVFHIRNRKTGRITSIAERRRAMRGNEGKLAGFEGVWTDISLQALVAKQRDEFTWDHTFGLITMGAAHDLNNKLTGILSFSELHLSELDGANPLAEGLRTIRDNARVASQLLNQIAALHEARIGSREHVDLNKFVTATAQILGRVISSRIKIETALDGATLVIYGDPVRLQRLIIAWALQAAVGMPRHGGITVATSVAKRDSREFASLTLTDTGGELPKDLIESGVSRAAFQVDETLAAGVLNQWRNFATTHGGTFKIESLPSGTRVELLLPTSNFTEESQQVPRKRWILVISESPELLSETVKSLEGQGIIALIAADEWERQLNPNWFNWDAVMFHGRETIPARLAALRERKLAVKTIICFSSGDLSEVDTGVSNTADLLIGPDLAQGGMVKKIANLMA
ncbi:MAG TPA: PAS domain-containing protein [Candidatus Binatia bacterium]|nr:PAS domain-containing protein [Candidatus Binatia bacterium]